MIGLHKYKVLNAPEGENKFGEPNKNFTESGQIIDMKVVMGAVEKIENGVLIRKPSLTGHTFSKNLRQGQRLQSQSQLYEIQFVDNTPRLSIVHLQEVFQ